MKSRNIQNISKVPIMLPLVSLQIFFKANAIHERTLIIAISISTSAALEKNLVFENIKPWVDKKCT